MAAKWDTSEDLFIIYNQLLHDQSNFQAFYKQVNITC